MQPSSIIFVALLSPIILFITLASVMAPAAFAQSSYPDGRVLMDASFLVVLFLVIEGFLLGMILNQLHDLAGETVTAKLQILSAVFVLIMILYPLYDAYKSFRSIPEYHAYATAWDSRDARIKAATLMGLDQIVESSLDAPGQLADISTDPNNWVNNCVAQFYSLASISAVP